MTRGVAPLLLAIVLALVPGSGARAGATTGAAGLVSDAAVIPLTGRVTDAAQMLPPGVEAALSAELARFERATHHQLVVVTVPSLGKRDVAAFTRDLANAWGIGRKGYDDGVVLLVAPHERKARIEVGKGLKRVLPDAVCQRMMDAVIVPRFRAGDMAGGIVAGSRALMARLG